MHGQHYCEGYRYGSLNLWVLFQFWLEEWQRVEGNYSSTPQSSILQPSILFACFTNSTNRQDSEYLVLYKPHISIALQLVSKQQNARSCLMLFIQHTCYTYQLVVKSWNHVSKQEREWWQWGHLLSSAQEVPVLWLLNIGKSSSLQAFQVIFHSLKHRQICGWQVDLHSLYCRSILLW